MLIAPESRVIASKGGGPTSRPPFFSWWCYYRLPSSGAALRLTGSLDRRVLLVFSDEPGGQEGVGHVRGTGNLSALGAILGDVHELYFELDGHRSTPRARRSRHDTWPDSLARRLCPSLNRSSGGPRC